MKKSYFLMLMALVFLLVSCRTELDSQQDNPSEKNQLKISFIKNNEILKNKDLVQMVAKIQSEKLKNSKFSKTSQDSLLSDATINTENVMLVEKGDKKTYTFPVTRNSYSSKVENLVLEKKTSNTYDGILIRYNLTVEENALMKEGHYVDLANKVQFFDIKNLQINQKVTTDVIGCYQITWETGVCASGQHGYGDTSCTLTGSLRAGEPSIISIVNTCGGGSGTSSGSDPNFPGSTGEPTGTYDTSPYTGTFEDYQAYLLEINRVFRLKLSSSQLSWYDAHTTIGMELAKFYYEDNSAANLSFLKSVIDYMRSSNNAQDTLLFANIVSFLKQNGSYQENWNLIMNIFNEHNPDLGIAVLNFINENPDTLNRAEIINRIKALDNALTQNPNLLLDIPCGELPKWQDVATHQVPQSVKTKLENIKNQTSWWSNWEITDLDDGASARINMDVFPVHINSLPNKPNSTQKYSPEEFFNFFRLNLNLFAEKFTPIVDSYYGINETALWNSSNPLGALIHIEIPIDNGTVVCSGFGPKAWVFSTIKAPMSMGYDGIHPVSGNRLFGYYVDPSDNTMYIYTRGVDRVSQVATSFPNLANYLIEVSAFQGADQLWKGMQDKLTEYINNRGGNANKIPETTYRPNYSKVRNYLKGNALLSSLGCH